MERCYLGFPVAGALIGCLLWGAAYRWMAPSKWIGGFSEIVDPPVHQNFLTVMGWHYGLYLGFAIGLGIAIWRLRRGDVRL